MARAWMAAAVAVVAATTAAAEDDRDGNLETTAELLTACAPAADAPDREL